MNRHHCPILIAQWQYAVTRKDMVEAFSFKDFKEVQIVVIIFMIPPFLLEF